MINSTVIPTLGSLIGKSGSSDLLAQINSELGGSNFFNNIDDILGKGRQMFVNNFVTPIRQLGTSIKRQITGFHVADKFIPLISQDQFELLPSCMHEPILAYEPIRELFDQGRLFGFGYVTAPVEDVWGRMIDNGRVEDIAAAMDKDGVVEFNWEFKSTDPDLDVEELDCIEQSRDYIDYLLNETSIDPTDFPNDRG